MPRLRILVLVTNRIVTDQLYLFADLVGQDLPAAQSDSSMPSSMEMIG